MKSIQWIYHLIDMVLRKQVMLSMKFSNPLDNEFKSPENQELLYKVYPYYKK